MKATVTLALLLLAAAPALQWSATIGEGYSPPAANDQLVCTLSRQAKVPVGLSDRAVNFVQWGNGPVF